MTNDTKSGLYHIIENDIRLLTSEIYRLCKLPYFSVNNQHKIMYLEELLSAYERDLKKYE